MIPKGLFSQIGMIILSVGIIITYIKPTFAEIKEIQDDIAVYERQFADVQSVNSDLSSKVARLESVTNNNRTKLSKYIPNEVDPIAVQRDLKLIAEEAGVIYRGAGSEGTESNNRRRSSNSADSDEETNLPSPHNFTMTVEGTYPQIKRLFSLLERNEYPLEVRSMDISKLEGIFLAVDLSLATYSYKTPEDVSN